MLQASSITTAKPFFLEPTRQHYLLGISRSIGLAHTSVKRDLDRLRSLGIITGDNEIKGQRTFPVYRADLGSDEFKKAKFIFNISQLIHSGLIEDLRDKLMPSCMVLFGSYQRGEDIESSDIDIFLECNEKDIDLKTFENTLNRKIQLHFCKRFADYPEDLKSNIINGIVLHGFLEAYG